MKGPHFFEKRKKEMARQEKAKQKAERKAQRKAGKDGGEAEDTFDEFGQLIEGGAAAAGDEANDADAATDGDKDAPAPGGQTP